MPPLGSKDHPGVLGNNESSVTICLLIGVCVLKAGRSSDLQDGRCLMFAFLLTNIS